MLFMLHYVVMLQQRGTKIGLGYVILKRTSISICVKLITVQDGSHASFSKIPPFWKENLCIPDNFWSADCMISCKTSSLSPQHLPLARTRGVRSVDVASQACGRQQETREFKLLCYMSAPVANRRGVFGVLKHPPQKFRRHSKKSCQTQPDCENC